MHSFIPSHSSRSFSQIPDYNIAYQIVAWWRKRKQQVLSCIAFQTGAYTRARAARRCSLGDRANAQAEESRRANINEGEKARGSELAAGLNS